MPTTIQKTYRYRLKPTPQQEKLFRQFAGARRFVWNWGLARRKTHHRETGKTLSVAALCGELTQLKRQPGYEWLRLMNAQSLQQALRDLDRAYVNFFEKRAQFPRFKRRKGSQLSFRIPQSLSLRRDRLFVPKVGEVRLILHRQTEGALKSATFTQDATGKWYVTLVCHVVLPERVEPPLEPVVGIDVGLKDLAVTSDSERTPAPRYYRAAERKLKRLQRHLSRCKKGSRNREKARSKVARQHQRVANLRNDFLHKLSHTLTRQYNTVCIETLNVSGLAKSKLAKSVLDAGWSTLRFQLTYKAHWRGKRLVLIGRFFPSSRLCPVCGTVNPNLTLSERTWTCACGVSHDRDLNAARNIRDEGLRLLLADGTSDSRNASRVLVRPATGGLGALTEETAPQAVR
jgi:putative transposase